MITSPEWSGTETGGRRYSPFTINVERLKPWHTLTGRMHFYLDHDWMTELGEGLPVYRPPLSMAALFGEPAIGNVSAGSASGVAGLTVRYLTPHSKWSIHSEYQDNLFMLSLSRGGQNIWMSDKDADKVGITDNDWVEAVNRNGVVVARAVVSHRMPEGTVYMYHAQDRLIDVPLAETSGKRGGIHNSLTRLLVKPSHLIGGYAQLTFAFNYLGPTGNQRDEVTVIRKRSQEVDLLMRPMAQMAMVMNLDKCIGCHTCSVTCKQAWTNRAGTEYVWFNNVETRPGLGYPRTYEDQDKWKGGWELDNRGRLRLKGGGRLKKLLTIFSNPKLPSIQEYYEPWTYDYATLTDAPAQEHTPVARPKSLISGENMKVEWSANWDDDLGGSTATARQDPMLKNIADKVKFEFEQTFMFYLPRICEHCLNPSCAASCPSGAIYKRTEDGIVLVDQDRCRGWRMCVSGCPYKKVYFNHRTGKAEKCTFCFPRVEVGLPTVCSETCVGRLRYIGLVLYDADRVLDAASAPDDRDLYEAQRSVFLDPHDPDVIRHAETEGIPRDWILAAQRSPVWALINTYEVALPLHPEYRTLPMVWYIPPLSPVVDVVKDTGHDAEDNGNLFAAIDALRIPVEYLAELFTAGDVEPVDRVLRKLAAMRSYMRDISMGRDPDASIPAAVGMSEEDMYDMYRLLAIAKYDERYVIPPAHAEQAHSLEELATECSLDYEGGPGMGGSGPFGEGSGSPIPIAVENFQMLRDRQTSETVGGAERQGGTGQPAQLGREGVACRPVPAEGAGDVSPKHPRPALPPDQLMCAWQSASLLLGYPDEPLLDQLDLIRTASERLPAGLGEPIAGFAAHLESTALQRLQTEYVDTFDTRRRCTLFLTYFAHGDTRKRGLALLRFKQTYLRSGFVLDAAGEHGELPDHLCVVLEYAATVDQRLGWRLLLDHRAGLELLRLALRDAASPWAGVVHAVCATLPRLRGDERDAVRRLAAAGPPEEEVGLAPFASPQFSPGAGA